MKKIATLLSIVLGAIALAPTAFAQENTDGEARVDFNRERVCRRQSYECVFACGPDSTCAAQCQQTYEECIGNIPGTFQAEEDVNASPVNGYASCVRSCSKTRPLDLCEDLCANVWL